MDKAEISSTLRTTPPQVSVALPGSRRTSRARPGSLRIPGVGSVTHFLFGLSLFSQGFSVVTVGRHTGVQVCLIFFAICAALRVSKGRFSNDWRLAALLAVWVTCLFISVHNAGWHSQSTSIHAMVGFCVSLSIAAVFGLWGDVPRAYDKSLQRGLVAGAALSALYGLYQQGAFRLGLPFALPPLNNPSFSLITEGHDPGLRSFALFSEPSIYAAYLIPIAAALLFQAADQRGLASIRQWLVALLVFAGLLASGSFSVCLTLPVVLLLCLFSQRRGFGPFAKAVAVLLSVLVMALFLSSATHWASRLNQELGDRLSDLFQDQSLVTRYGMDLASLKIFLEHPLFGSGVLPDPGYFYPHIPSWVPDYQAASTLGGGDSLPLVIISGQGAFGFTFFVILLIWGWRRTRSAPFLRLSLIGALVPMTLQCGNYDLYLIWVVLGLCLAQHTGAAARRAPAVHFRDEARPRAGDFAARAGIGGVTGAC